MNTQKNMHVKKGDKVVVISGKDKGKIGEILRVLPKKDKVVVQGVNIIVRHTKPTMQGQKGSLVKKEAPIYSAKVMLYDPNAQKGVRVGYKMVETSGVSRKVRYSKRSGDTLDS